MLFCQSRNRLQWVPQKTPLRTRRQQGSKHGSSWKLQTDSAFVWIHLCFRNLEVISVLRQSFQLPWHPSILVKPKGENVGISHLVMEHQAMCHKLPHPKPWHILKTTNCRLPQTNHCGHRFVVSHIWCWFHILEVYSRYTVFCNLLAHLSQACVTELETLPSAL